MSVFSKIITGQIPCYKIAEDEKFFAFLDINPLVEGHTLVVPKLEIDNFFNLPEEFLRDIFIFSKPIAKAIAKAFDCNRCGISVVGLEVPHAHVHCNDELFSLNPSGPNGQLGASHLGAGSGSGD